MELLDWYSSWIMLLVVKTPVHASPAWPLPSPLAAVFHLQMGLLDLSIVEAFACNLSRIVRPLCAGTT